MSLNKLKPKTEFSKNVLTLMTGTTIAQAIPIAISPILTRLYTPQDFGVLALFVAITSIFGSIANGRYELAIMLPKKDEDAINIVALGFIIVSTLSFLLFLLVVILHDDILYLLNNKQIDIWLYFIPVSVFLIGCYNILNYFNNRKKQYRNLAKTTIIKSIIAAVLQLSLGFFKVGTGGLIGSQILSNVFANIKLLQSVIKDKILISKINKLKIVALSKRYKDFPKFSLWANLLNTLSIHLTNILISFVFNIKTLGFYSLVQKLLGMPSSIIGRSMSQVFFQQAIQERHQTSKSIISFKSTLKKLIIIALPPFIFLYFYIENLFSLIFGDKWIIAGIYGKILLPFFFMNFISSPLAITMTVFEKQKNSLFVNISLILSALSSLCFGYFLHLTFEVYLYVFSFIMCINYFSFIFYYYKLSNG